LVLFQSPDNNVMNAITDPSQPPSIDLAAIFRDSNVAEVLDKLDAELVGLKPVKTRIREIAALLVIAKARASIGLQANAPSLHMSFTGKPPWHCVWPRFCIASATCAKVT
jgi:hypothetical protein